MTPFRSLVPLAALFVLAACDDAAPVGNEMAANVAAPAASPSPTSLAALPDAFRGRWATSTDQCGGGSGLMTVNASDMTFQGTRATIDEIVQTRPGRLTATLHYTNRMGKWDSPTTMTLRNDDKTLVRDDTHPTGRFTYERCAG